LYDGAGCGSGLAKSAAPSDISDRATIKVLTKSGFEVARQGDNGFGTVVDSAAACMKMNKSWRRW
jgi:hypothetical protein